MALLKVLFPAGIVPPRDRLLVTLGVPSAVLVASLFVAYYGATNPLMFGVAAALVCLGFGLYAAYHWPLPALSSAFSLVLIAGTKFRGRSATASLSSEVDAQVKFELMVYGVLGLLVLMALVRRSSVLTGLRRMEAVLLGYVGLAMASALWSPVPKLTLVRAGQLAVLFALAIAAYRMMPLGRLLRALSNAVLVYVLLCGAAAVLVPGAAGGYVDYEGVGRFSWFAVHPIAAATLAAVAALLILTEGLFGDRGWRERRFGLPVGLFLIPLLVILGATHSRGPTAAFLVGAAVLVVGKHLRVWSILALLAFTVSLLVFFSSTGETPADLLLYVEKSDSPLAELVLRNQSVKAVEGFSGRFQLWSSAWPLVLERPIVGLGFQGSRGALLEVAWWASHAHNALLQSLLDLGLVGTVLLWGVILHSLVVTIGSSIGPARELTLGNATALSLGVFLVVNSVSSQSFTGPPGFEWLLLLTCVLMAERKRLSAGLTGPPALASGWQAAGIRE